MRHVRIPLLVSCFGSALLFLAGCHSEPPQFSVKGRVVFKEDGKPVPQGIAIFFESTTPPFKRSSSNIGPDGTFVLGTNRLGSGAIQGEHRVRLTGTATEAQPDPVAALSHIMDPRYADYGKSGIVLTIQPDHNNEFVIEVERGSAKGELPKNVQEAVAETLVSPES